MKRFTARVATAMLTPLLFASVSIATANPAHAANYVPGVTPGFFYNPTTQTMYYTAWPGDENGISVFQDQNASGQSRIAIYDDNSSQSFGTPGASFCSTSDLEDGEYSNDPTTSEALVHCDASRVQHVVLYGGDMDDTLSVGPEFTDGNDPPNTVTVEMHGGDGNDTFDGGDGSGTLSPKNIYGDGGDDTYDAPDSTTGSDTFDGGVGSDTVDYSNVTNVGVTVNLSTGTERHASHTDTLRNVENVNGSDQSDSITGDGNANVLHGLGGADFISGGGGPDKLYGDGGSDWIDARDGAADPVIDCGSTTGDLVAYDAGLETPVNCLTTPSPVTSVIDTKSNTVYLFWKDANNHLVEKTQTNGVWNAPVYFDGVHFQSFGEMTSGPGAAIHPNGDVDVWWRGSDKRLWHATYSKPYWAGPYIIPTGTLGSAPSASVDASDNEYTFWQGTENTLWSAWFTTAGTHFAHAAKPTGGQQLASRPSVISQPNGFQHVWWQGLDNHLYLVGCLNGVCTSPINMTDNPAALLASAPSATFDAVGNEFVYWKGTDGALWTRTRISGQWTASKRIGFAPSGDPAVVLRADAWQQVFWMGTDGNVSEVDLVFATWYGPYNRGH